MVARNYSYHNPGGAKGDTGGSSIGFTMILIIIRLAYMEKALAAVDNPCNVHRRPKEDV